MSCRTFLEYEPDFSPNIAALPMRELFTKLKAHVAAEKAAKESKASFKTTPNPGRSDPNNRFSNGQTNVPLVDQGAASYHDELEASMARHEAGFSGEVHVPLVDGVEVEVPLTPGEKWEAEMAGHEDEMMHDMSSGAEALAAVQAELDGYRARERAAQSYAFFDTA